MQYSSIYTMHSGIAVIVTSVTIVPSYRLQLDNAAINMRFRQHCVVCDIKTMQGAVLCNKQRMLQTYSCICQLE